MKKEILLSFKPYAYESVFLDLKKYEYRKRFLNEEVTAYLYLSLPIQQVVGILELGKTLVIDKEILKYDKETIVYKRLKVMQNEGIKNAIPIKSLQLFEEPISLKTLREIDKDFIVPQSYLYINKKEKIYKFLKSQKLKEKEFEHKHDEIYIDNLGKKVSEIE